MARGAAAADAFFATSGSKELLRCCRSLSTVRRLSGLILRASKDRISSIKNLNLEHDCLKYLLSNYVTFDTSFCKETFHAIPR
jgi:hypothetical protein